MSQRQSYTCRLATVVFAVLVYTAMPFAQGRRSSPVQSFPSAPPDVAPESSDQNQQPLKTETIIVPVRVVVRDPQGHAVLHLGKSDFKLYQDGKQQDIINFAAVANPVNFPALAADAGNSVSPATGVSSAPVALVLPQRFVALFFDDVHITMQDLQRARNAADQYVRASLEPADRVAIFTVSGQSQQDFTSDRDALHKSLMALLPHAVSAGETDSSDGCPPMDFPEADAIANQGSAQVLNVATDDALQCAYSGEREFRAEARDLASRTAEHLVLADEQETEAAFRRIREVVRRVSVLSGQRDILLISPGFLYQGHDTELAEIIDRAIQSDIVINTLDARGLYAPDAGGDISQRPVSRAAGSEGILDSYRMADQNLMNNVLAELSDSTGGVAFLNNNDFNAGFRRMAEAPEIYYLLAYSPKNLKVDGHYHHIKVELAAKQNFTVEARHGFYAPMRSETTEQAAKREIDDALFSVNEQHDLPIGLETRIEKTAGGADKLDIFAELDIAHLHFQKQNGVNQEALTLVAGLFDSNGNYVTGTEKVLNLNLKDATLADLSKTGASSELNIDVKPGTYFLRLVARDSNDEHIAAQNATVDVPN